MDSEATIGTVPIHHQIADAIRGRITSGDLKPGDPIPTIDELSKEWTCAAGSARHALDVLRSEGLITSGRGKPATVREAPQRIKLALGWAQKQKNLVLRPESERAVTGAIELTAGVPISKTISTHKYEFVRANAELAAEFSLPIGTLLLRRTYEITDPKNDRRLSFSVSHIPKFLIESNPDLLDETKEPWPGGHQHQLYTVGIEIDRFTRSVIAMQPAPGTRQKWGMDT